MPDERTPPAEDPRTPVERRIARSFEDPAVLGQPLSARARRTRRSVESYLKAGELPRYMQRSLDIERHVADHGRRLEHEYRRLADECRHDAGLFARRWRELAHSWRFDEVNDLIREHNEWYPVERDLPFDPRTRDYVKVRGRSYRRAELGPEWVLERFPARAASGPGPPRRHSRARA
jgi:hypothetical protein